MSKLHLLRILVKNIRLELHLLVKCANHHTNLAFIKAQNVCHCKHHKATLTQRVCGEMIQDTGN